MQNLIEAKTMKNTIHNTLQFLQLLCDGHDRKTTELASIMNVSRHTIYNYIDAFEQAGFVIDKHKGTPRLMKMDPQAVELENLIHFTAEEASLLSQLMQSLDGTNPLKQSLQKKLHSFIRASHLPPLIDAKNADLNVRTLGEALERRCQVVLKGYHSGHSNTVEDRHVEPVLFSANYRQIHAFDIDKHAMRAFVINRMDNVELTATPFAFANLHKVPETDCFWMSGDIVEEVTLQLDELALNLLHEEYPLSQQFPVSSSDASSLVTIPIRSLLGIGRFVLGLPGHCKVLRGNRLITYIETQKKLF